MTHLSLTVSETNEEWDIFSLRELSVLINGYVCPAGGTSATHWQAVVVRGPSSGHGSCSKESFRIYGGDSDLEVFSPKLLTE